MVSEGGIPISAREGSGLDNLLGRVDAVLREGRLRCRLRVPYDRAGVLGALYARGHVARRDDRPDAIWLEVEVPRALAGIVAPYQVDREDEEARRAAVPSMARAQTVAGR
jgi:GTP-binding protein HflX